MAKVSFLTQMLEVSNMIKKGVCDEDAILLFNDVVTFVESCSFSKSETTKFICKHWRLTARQLVSLYQSETGVDKSANTFRSQKSTLSTQLYGLLPDFEPVVFSAEFQNDKDILDKRSSLRACIDALDIEDTYPSSIFCSEVTNYFDDSFSKKTFSLDECQTEIKALRLLKRSNLYNFLDQLDSDKLKFILSVLNSPLTSNRKRSASVDKVKLLKELGVCEKDYSSLSMESEKVIEKKVYVEVPEMHKYKFAITKSMANILDERLSTKATDKEVAWYSNADDNERQKYCEQVAKGLYPMTEEGFKAFIGNINILCLKDVLDGNYEAYNSSIRDFSCIEKKDYGFYKD